MRNDHAVTQLAQVTPVMCLAKVSMVYEEINVDKEWSENSAPVKWGCCTCFVS